MFGIKKPEWMKTVAERRVEVEAEMARQEAKFEAFRATMTEEEYRVWWSAGLAVDAMGVCDCKCNRYYGD